MTSCLSDMRTVRPQGRTFRITQPHGLRVSYLGTLPGLCNRSNKIVGGYRADYTLPYETTILKYARRKQWSGFYCPKIFVLSAAFTPVVLRFVHRSTLTWRRLWLILKTAQMILAGRLFVLTSSAPIDLKIILRANSSLIPHMYGNGSELASYLPFGRRYRCGGPYSFPGRSALCRGCVPAGRGGEGQQYGLGVMTTAKPRPSLAPGETRAYPVLPLRDIVVFPHMIAPLFVGRKKSILALDEVMRSDTFILLATQKNASDDEPATEAIYEIGMLASVLQLLKLPDGTVKILVEGAQEPGRWSRQHSEDCPQPHDERRKGRFAFASPLDACFLY